MLFGPLRGLGDARTMPARVRDKGPVLRLYAWDPPCLSIGYYQDLQETCDQSYLRQGWNRGRVGVPRVGRPCSPTSSRTARWCEQGDWPDFPAFPDGHLRSHRRSLAEGLRIAGLEVSFGGRGLPVVSGKAGRPAFCSLGKGITVGGRKVVGSALAQGRPGLPSARAIL